jgi:hypothetical protein
MIFILSMIGAFACYFAMFYFYSSQKTAYVALTTAFMVVTIYCMGLYIETQNEQIKELKSPCPEYEEVKIKYYKLKEP